MQKRDAPGGRKQKKKGMRDISFHNNSLTYLLQHLGWLIRYAINPDTGQPYRFSELTPEVLYDIKVLQAYLDWHINVRHNGNCTARKVCNIAIKLSQWRLQQSVGIRREDAHPTIQPLMKLRSQYNPNEGHRPRTSVTAIEQRMLEHAECEQVVAYLRAKALYFEQQFKDGHETREVMEDNWMDYLIIALLTYGGMRIREICEMALNQKRLYFNQSDGCYWCDLLPAEHKTSGDRDYPLFPGPLQEQLTSDFTYYFKSVRPNLPHAFVFFKRLKSCRGKPVKKLSYIVKRIMFNASCELFGEEQAKGMNPHDFRRSLATWFAHYGRMEDVMIFAQLCGHSPDMLLKLYAQVRSREQTKQAPAAFNRTAAREQALKQSGTNQDVRVTLKRFIDGATPDTLTKLLVIVENSFPA
ncbi:MAG: site-specific integrase [Snowella sp.]|nr:site-specific integrase [Snowella sp.]